MVKQIQSDLNPRILQLRRQFTLKLDFFFPNTFCKSRGEVQDFLRTGQEEKYKNFWALVLVVGYHLSGGSFIAQ